MWRERDSDASVENSHRGRSMDLNQHVLRVYSHSHLHECKFTTRCKSVVTRKNEIRLCPKTSRTAFTLQLKKFCEHMKAILTRMTGTEECAEEKK